MRTRDEATWFAVITSGRRYLVGQHDDTHLIWDKRRRAVVRTFPGPHGAADAYMEFSSLETRARDRRRHRWAALVGIAAIGLAAAVTILALSSSDVRSSPGPQVASDAASLTRFENPLGGYAFRYPTGWNVASDDTSTEIMDPDGTLQIAIDVVPHGEIAQVSRTVALELTKGWQYVTLEAPQARKVGDGMAVSVGGTGVDPSGSQLRVLAIAVEGGSRTYAITVSLDERADLTKTTPAIERILSTFRVAPA
jgi:hypothetical protein